MRNFRDGLTQRADYMAAYAELKSRTPHFYGVPRQRAKRHGFSAVVWCSRVVRRLWGQPAGGVTLVAAPDDYLIGQLRKAEVKLTLAQVGGFRGSLVRRGAQAWKCGSVVVAWFGTERALPSDFHTSRCRPHLCNSAILMRWGGAASGGASNV